MSEEVGCVLSEAEIKRALDTAQMVLRDTRISRREGYLLANAFKQLYFAKVDALRALSSRGTAE